MSAPVPPVAVDVSDAYVLVLTPANILLYERSGGSLVSALDADIDAGASNAQHTAFPRFGAFSPDQAYVAVVGDDKSVRVWRPTELRYGAEVLCERLPKRAGTLRWVPCTLDDGTSSFEVVLADKFGDVWSFAVDTSHAPTPLAAADEDDESAVPRLGHVSMVTAVDFIGDGVPSEIITCDRDEHIRISRWGRERLGYVISQYLLGSRGAVGAVAVLSEEATTRAGLGAGAPAIVSADGGEGLRLWSKVDESYVLCSSVALDRDTLASTVAVNAETERLRERAANNMAFRGVFNQDEPSNKRQKHEAESAEQEGPTLIITNIIPHAAGGHDWLLVTLDGCVIADSANAFFTLRLDELRAGREQPVADVNVHRVGAPVIDIAVSGSDVWAICDDRPGIGQGTAPLHRFTWTNAGIEASTVPGALGELARPAGEVPDMSVPEPKKNELTAVACTPRAITSDVTLSKLCFYTALTTWPKPATNGEGPHAGFFLAKHTDQVSQDMLQRFQAGKRAAGRAKNQAKIREQYGEAS